MCHGGWEVWVHGFSAIICISELIIVRSMVSYYVCCRNYMYTHTHTHTHTHIYIYILILVHIQYVIPYKNRDCYRFINLFKLFLYRVHTKEWCGFKS